MTNGATGSDTILVMNSSAPLGERMAVAGGDRAGPGGCKRRGLHCGRQGRPALVGAICPALLCRLLRLGLLRGLPARTAQLLDVARVQDHLDDAGGAADR